MKMVLICVVFFYGLSCKFFWFLVVVGKKKDVFWKRCFGKIIGGIFY